VRGHGINRWLEEMTMEIRRMGPIGAEITDVDVKAMDDACFQQIYKAWLDCNVIVVRDQELSIDDYLSYSRCFGTVCLHPSKVTRHPDHPEVTLLGVNKFEPNGKLNMDVYRRGAEGFHTDGSYEDVPYKATQLYAIAIPSRGGDTYFASAYTAYEALSEQLKEQLEGKLAAYVYGGRKKANRLLDEADRNARPVHHPLLQTHPETGRKLLYFDQNKILRIEGMEEKESDAIIEELTAYMAQPLDQYRHKWRRGDVVIWDNRCSYHKAAGDYPPEEDRIHWRVSIKERTEVR
jgi:taurine dioxygenase